MDFPVREIHCFYMKKIIAFVFAAFSLIANFNAVTAQCCMKDSIIDKFREVASSGELEELLKSRSTLNVELATFGGKVFWTTIEVNGWKLQNNEIFGNWRLLDADNVRHAWGLYESQLEDLLYNRPTSTMANYQDAGFTFVPYSAEQPSKHHSVILIHGWGKRAFCLQSMASDRCRQIQSAPQQP